MEDDEIPECKICREPVYDQNHNSTVNHRFCFAKWQYNEYKKPLVKDRHGIDLAINIELVNNLNVTFAYQENLGKYSIKVTPHQLHLHNNTITLKCQLKNNSKNSIYITSLNLLHPSDYFKLTQKQTFGEERNKYLQLAPNATYNFKINFSTRILMCASYKIPVSCDLQTCDNKKNWTMVRSFVVIVDDGSIEKKAKVKSPFTSKPWSDVYATIPPINDKSRPDRYPIPSALRRLYIRGLQTFDGISAQDQGNLAQLKVILDQKLTADNYANYWHIVLWLEEAAQFIMLMKYNMAEVTIDLKKDKLILEVPGLAEKRPSVIVGDFIRIKKSEEQNGRKQNAYKGVITKVTNESVEISYIDNRLLNQIEQNRSMLFDVSFMLGRLAFERMHAAVDRIVESRFVTLLFPERPKPVKSNNLHEVSDDSFKLFNQTIQHNAKQKEAVKKILNSVQTFPYIIFGPPGTGKSITLIEAILQIKKHTKKKILVCAPANSACDMLASKLIPYCKKKDLIRIHSATRELDSISDDLLGYSNIESGEIVRVKYERLASYRIVVTTLILIGRYCGKYHPDCVFVDEAAQAMEPESDVPIAFLNVGKQVVLAGDPKQLGPMVNKCPAEHGLGVSLLERLMAYDIYQPNNRRNTYDSNFITMLELNFRSHPEILSIPNQLFYDNKLKAVSRKPSRDPIINIAIYPLLQKEKITKGQPIEFCSVSGKEKKEGSSPSYFNLFEAKMVVKYTQALIGLNLVPEYKVRPDQIGVVTPYKRQVFKIQEGLKNNGIEGVEVGTTESFQGREKRIILISSVRAQHALLKYDQKYKLGFVKHDQRFNVALTRAISKLIVIGNPLVLRTDKKWNMFMQRCIDCNTFFGNQFPLQDNNFKLNVVQRFKNFKEKDDQYNLF